MAKTLRKFAPLLILAGVALMPRSSAPAGRPQARGRARADPDAGPGGPAGAPGATESDRGRQADAPGEIPAKGWKDILLRTRKEFTEDQVPLIAAGVTFYTLLAIFPGMAAFVSLYGLFADVAQAERHLDVLAVILPPDALGFLREQLLRLAAAHEGGLSFAFLSGLLISLWSANGAMKAMITGLNIAYEETETRTFIRKTLTSLAFTLGFLVFGLAAAAAVAAGPAIARLAGDLAGLVFRLVSWPLVLAALAVGLALLYRYGPSRDPAKWRWISWGSGVALVLWIAGSAAFSIYVANFANYNETYGSLGAVIGFMTWIWLSSLVVLLGAELNSEIEHQTARDTTVGPEAPLGQRNAAMADQVGAAQVQ